ncbi:MAG TPA: GAP family protein [Actinomycetota bacterium]|nr:GAP family protein [Actinomycetota bacterium]
MQQLIIDILPFAFGVFASPLPVVLGVVMLFTPRPKPTSVAYVVTWVAGVSAATVLFALLAGLVDAQDGLPGWATWLRVLLGAGLVVMGVRMWLSRHSKPTPGWLTELMDSRPREAVRYGVLMSAANPKELVMALGAGLVVGTSEVGLAGSAGAIAVFVVVGASSVAAPLVVFLVGGDGTLRWLDTAREWLQRNNAAVAAVVLGLLGVFLFLGGLAKL